MARPVAHGLFEMTSEGVTLLAGRNKHDGGIVFPCPQGAQAALYDPMRLRREGTLWTWTIQRFPPKAPFDGPSGEAFVPYAVGYVEFQDQVIVEGRIVESDFGRLRIGLPMEVTTEVYRVDPHGEGVLTFAFRPKDQSA